MLYVVRPRDSLRRIALRELGDEHRWREIAERNRLSAPYKILIGQALWLPERSSYGVPMRVGGGTPPLRSTLGGSDEATLAVARGFVFVLADEVLPSGKVVRKIAVVAQGGVAVTDLRAVAERIRVESPEIYGIRPLDPTAKVSIGQHALGANRSPYISASTNPRGAPNIQGRPVWIDIEKSKRAGVVFHSSEEIIKDLDRLAAQNHALADRVARLKQVILNVEREVLLEGNVPARAVKSAVSMRVTQGLRFVQVVGLLMTTVDLTRASIKSVRERNALPIAAETLRQGGGWGGSALGGFAGAWAAAKIGGVVGGTLFVETGPGALLTGAAGALIFGAAGYFGADWVADLIDAN